jgi:hypothetical protein
MVYKKIQNEEGNYIDVQQVRWDILEAHEAWTPQGKNVGWDEFDNLEAAAKSYGLTYSPIEPGEELDKTEEFD